MNESPPTASITTSKGVSDLCRRLAQASFVTVDTEFLRDRTYWPKLCLIQIACPGEAAVIDPLAENIDLAPFYALMANPHVVKVFHAARQDIEIFHHQAGIIPSPLFDTQIAAMVCGYGDSVGYETLASKIAKAQIDKTARYTDWSHRPLNQRQLAYAIGDVTHLITIYETLSAELEKSGRRSWLDEEIATLAASETYDLDPENAWRRIKTRSTNARFLGVLKEVTAWREREAQARDVPRNRILRDEAVIEIAGMKPRARQDLARLRSLGRGFSESRAADQIVEAVKCGLAIPDEQLPRPRIAAEIPRGLGPVIELLKVLLKMKCDHHRVAQKLIANVRDLEAIAAGDTAPVPALVGWRREIFGEDALSLKRGEIALAIHGREVRIVTPAEQKRTRRRPGRSPAENA